MSLPSINQPLRRAIPAGIAAGAFTLLGAFVARYGITVPYWDQWELVPVLVKMHDGTLTVSDLIAQHNAHRILFPRIIMLGLASASEWNIAWELVVNVTLGLCIFSLLAVLGIDICRRTGALTGGWVVPLAAITAFSLAQWRNWLWGWQLQIFLCVACALAALLMLWHAHRYKTAVVPACVVAAIATFSFAAGLAVWPAGLAVLVWCNPERRKFNVGLWVGAGVAMVAAYLYGFALPGDANPPRTTATGIAEALAYIFTFLGGAAANAYPELALVAGIIACFVIARYGFEAWQDPGQRHQFAILKGVGAFVFGAACIAAMGRGGEGIEQAAASRYTTFSASYWFIAIISALALAQRRSELRKRIWQGVALCMVGAVLANSAYGAWAGSQRGNAMNAARTALFAGENPEVLERLYPDVDILMERREDLKRLRLNVFR